MLDFFKGRVTPRDLLYCGVIIALAVVLVSAYYFLLYMPDQEEIAAMQAERADLQRELVQAREIEANIEALRQEAEKWTRLVDLFEQRLPTKREIPGLIRKFEGISDDIGLRVELSTLPTTRDAKKETIPYQVVCRGSFHQIVTFINELERDERYLKVSDLDIEEEEAGVSEASFTLSTFRFIETSTPTTETAS
jgi:Tfp pilus assembly protein PilO